MLVVKCVATDCKECFSFLILLHDSHLTVTIKQIKEKTLSVYFFSFCLDERRVAYLGITDSRLTWHVKSDRETKSGRQRQNLTDFVFTLLASGF